MTQPRRVRTGWTPLLEGIQLPAIELRDRAITFVNAAARRVLSLSEGEIAPDALFASIEAGTYDAQELGRYEVASETTDGVVRLLFSPTDDAPAVHRELLTQLRTAHEELRDQRGRLGAVQSEQSVRVGQVAALTDIGAALQSSLGYQEVLDRICAFSVPRMADWCLLDLEDQAGVIRRVAVAQGDPARADLALRLRRWPATREIEAGPTFAVVAPTVWPEVTDATLESVARDAEHARALRSVAPQSAIALPLVARGRQLGVLTFWITDSKRRYSEGDLPVYEEIARRATQALDRAELSRSVRSATERAQAAEHRKDEFLAMLGHELRNPLAPILSAVEVVRMRGESSDEIQVIERQTKHLARLVDDLLDLSRIERDKVELDPHVVELADLVEEAIDVARPRISAANQQLRVSVASEGMHVDADRTRMVQAFANLLVNASKYTPREGRIWVHALQTESVLELTVRDSGRGIAPDVLPQVFEPFVQDERSIDRAEGGLGLGLALVRALVERHGGTVEANSEGLGHGAEFVVTLPRTTRAIEQTAPIEAARTSEPPPATRTKRVLVVDDNRDACELLAMGVRVLGHQVELAYDGQSALQRVEDFTPDVCLLDIGLPEMSGHELARRLRARFPEHRMSLVAVTGYGSERDRADSLAAGFDLHLTKPVSFEDLAPLFR